MSYRTDESSLKDAFRAYGEIKSVRVVTDQKGKSRGYGFVEFKHRTDAKAAYDKGNGKRIDGRRVITDYEKGRTDRDWYPRYLGGGAGKTRYDRRQDDHFRKVIREMREEERGSRKRSSKLDSS